MSETSIRLELKEVNDSNVVTFTRETLYEDTFTTKNCAALTLIANSTHTAIDFGNVTTASVVILDSDQELNIKINGSSDEIVTDTLFLRGEVTSISVRNVSVNTANISYEVYET